MSLLATAILERAGGGHGFSGGGGGGGGGSYGGGGGFFFFGGGGGGGAGAGFGILILILIALFIFFVVIRPRLGRGGSRFGKPFDERPGAPTSPPSSNDWSHTDQPAINSVHGDLFPGTADTAMHPESSAEGLATITAHDPDFDKEAFLEQVQRTFFVVQEAWSQRKPDMSRQVMADGLWQQHKVQIQGYIDAHKRNVLEDLAVADLSINAAHSDATYDTITVRVTACCADYDVDDQSGKVIRGNRAVENWMEDWTFQRSSSATTKPAGTMTAHCPNCGAPLDLDLAGVCKYCKAPISSGAYDWVLARIAQVPAYY